MDHSPDGNPCFNHSSQRNTMTHDERIVLIQGLNDRLLYLSEKDRKQFLAYLDALYEVYPVPRVVYYGKDIKHQENGERISI